MHSPRRRAGLVRATFMLVFGLLIARPSAAVSVELVVDAGAGLHESSRGCRASPEGCFGSELLGSLRADRRGKVLLGIRGTLQLEGGEELVITRGEIDFRHPVPDRQIGLLVTATRGVFSFVYRPAGPNAFRAGWLELFGSNAPNAENSSGGEVLLLSLRARVRPAPASRKLPEPAFLGWIGLSMAWIVRLRLTLGT